MSISSKLRLSMGLFVAVCSVASLSNQAIAADTIRSQAIVDLSFDEDNGDVLDVATVGAGKDNGKLPNGARRVSSPFWNQHGKRALELTAGQKQYVQLADSPDVDRADALTFGFFFLSLHPLNDGAFHGVIAKRANVAAKNVTNYGINYMPKNDAFQLYVNDGNGFRVAAYSVKQHIGFRRMLYLTASFEVGDAPAPDADTDKDDVRIRLFINGRQVKPTAVTNGQIAGNDGWLPNLNVAGLLNDVPLTIGSSLAGLENTSGLYDEFTLFPRALSPEEVSKLFVEVAGADGARLAKQELASPAQAPGPRITSVSSRGMQIGKTTRLTITGQNLSPQTRLSLPIAGLEQKTVNGSNAGRLIVELTLPGNAAAGFYPLRTYNGRGVSNALVMAIDNLPQTAAMDSSPEKPATLPAAFSGMVSGSAQPRVYFQGKQGQRIVAEVEARRLGAGLSPVLEIKTARGAPLAIEWSKVFLKGDARAEVALPRDGLYYVELHDLVYRAPGQNPFRLKIGDLKLVDALFPPTAAATKSAEVELVGTGIAVGTKLTTEPTASDADVRLPKFPTELGLTGPMPVLRPSSSVEIVETAGAKPQQVDARFAARKHVPIVVNGRISKPDERDSYLLNVTPGQKLRLTVSARAIDSPLDAELTILVGGKVVQLKEDRPGSRDPQTEYTPPANVKQIEVAVRDLHGGGGLHFLYRLEIIATGQPNFSLGVNTPVVSLPADGAAIVELQVYRAGYNGPINLSVAGDDGLSVAPRQIPAGLNGKMFLTLARKGGNDAELRRLRIVGESIGLEPAIRKVAIVSTGPGSTAVPGHGTILPTAITEPVGLALSVTNTPPTLFRGVPAQIPVTVTRADQSKTRSLRLVLVTSEPPRRVNPKDPKKGNKPLVRSVPNQTLEATSDSGTLKILVPLDVAAGSINGVLRADLVPNAYSRRVLGTTYSRPIRLAVKNAAAVTLDAKTLSLSGEAQNVIRGTVKRTAGFGGSLDVTLTGLPKGYTVTKITVPGDQQQFEIAIAAPKEAKARDIPNVKLSVTATGGGAVLPARPVKLKVTPFQAAAAAKP